MQNNSDLKKLERQAFLTFFKDGLWDICLGLFIISWGLGLLTELAYLAGTWFVVLWFIVLGLKKWITYPRTGYVKLGTREIKFKVQVAILLGIVVLLGAAIMLVFAYDSRPQWISEYFPLLFCGMVALIVITVGEWLGVRRFLIHAALIFGAGVIHQWSELSWACTFITAGSVIFLIGLGILIKFLKDNPKPAVGGTDNLG
jgi:hypothetical protein